MESLDIAKTKSSFYCWIILAIFIGATLTFMVNFYNKTVEEISNNSIILNNRINLENYVD